MCAALLKMKKRATISFTRSKDWCQLHTLVYAPILRKYGRTELLHVSAKFRRPRTCSALSGTCAIGTNALTWWSSWSRAFAFQAVLLCAAAVATYELHVIGQYGYIGRLSKHAQVCAAGTSPLTWWSLL